MSVMTSMMAVRVMMSMVAMRMVVVTMMMTSARRGLCDASAEQKSKRENGDQVTQPGIAQRSYQS